ncbi:hypothetical protein DPMN_181600 [Dreissena polymorpha]|uniref:Uncharacterized protein n=1 Tax=Dreissena polymorpha TaxID=45954 RepID=A0A9D4DD71_DREPO|nr:hypothetical protein DPMN_181600 [Dreissena polymorpha]
MLYCVCRGQYLLKFCTSQHSFLLKLRTRLAAQDWGTGTVETLTLAVFYRRLNVS